MTRAGAGRDERPRDEPEHRALPDDLEDEDDREDLERPARRRHRRFEEPAEEESLGERESRERRPRRWEDERSGEAERREEVRRRARQPEDHDEEGADEEPPADRGRPVRDHPLSAARAARLAACQVAELTGRDPESVTSLKRADGGWKVGVEVVETHRIPDSADILAVYEAELDEDGELVAYRRTRRYPRGRTQED